LLVVSPSERFQRSLAGTKRYAQVAYGVVPPFSPWPRCRDCNHRTTPGEPACSPQQRRPSLCGRSGDEIDQAAWWSRHFDDLDAVLEFDALDDFGELIFALQSSPRFRSGIDHWPRCGRPDCENFFDRQLGMGASRNRIETFSVRDETIFTLTCVFGLNGPHLNRQTNGLHAMLIVGAGTRGGHKDD
jgi:hypothetical protein